MTLDDLQNYFKHQTTATEEYTPNGKLQYVLFNGRQQLPGEVDADKLETLIELLEGYEHEGYRDRTPLFIKPEAI